MFSPVGAVPEADLAIIAKQAKSQAAETAIKLTVFQEAGDGLITPVQPTESEPIKRSGSKVTGEDIPADVSDVVKKWSKK